jgi:hypothetical protein
VTIETVPVADAGLTAIGWIIDATATNAEQLLRNFFTAAPPACTLPGPQISAHFYRYDDRQTTMR